MLSGVGGVDGGGVVTGVVSMLFWVSLGCGVGTGVRTTGPSFCWKRTRSVKHTGRNWKLTHGEVGFSTSSLVPSPGSDAFGTGCCPAAETFL